MGLFSKLFSSGEKNFVSPMTGKVIAMENVPDPAFAQKMMGEGCGIDLSDGTIVAPFDVPDENFMAIKLNDTDIEINGIVQYAKEFIIL